MLMESLLWKCTDGHEMLNMCSVFLHFKGNIEQKLRELNVPSSVAAEIVKDIMGNPSQLQHGLVEAESAEQLDEHLTSFSG